MGQITGKDNNRVPTVEECNDAFGGDYVTQDDLSGFLTTSDISESHGISQCWVQLPGHLYTEWHDDGTASYEHIYLQPDGYTIEANWVE